jgi:hypothetical protein
LRTIGYPTNYAAAVDRAPTRLDAHDLGQLDWASESWASENWASEDRSPEGWSPEPALEAEVLADADSLLRTVTAPAPLEEPPGLDDIGPVDELPDAHDLTGATDPVVTAEQRAMLDFERTWWRSPGAKEQAIRDQFALSPTRYYQALNALLETPEALRYDAALVNRLRRLRSGRLRGRALD